MLLAPKYFKKSAIHFNLPLIFIPQWTPHLTILLGPYTCVPEAEKAPTVAATAYTPSLAYPIVRWIMPGWEAEREAACRVVACIPKSWWNSIVKGQRNDFAPASRPPARPTLLSISSYRCSCFGPDLLQLNLAGQRTEKRSMGAVSQLLCEEHLCKLRSENPHSVKRTHHSLLPIKYMLRDFHE